MWNLQKQLSRVLFSDWLINTSLQAPTMYLHKGDPINTKRFRKRLQRRALTSQKRFLPAPPRFRQNDA